MQFEPGDPEYVSKAIEPDGPEQLQAEGFTPVTSSAFVAVKYVESSQMLIVQFHRTKKEPEKPGARCGYSPVPRETYEAMLAAQLPDTPGKFFAREIRSNPKIKASKIEVPAG